MDTGRDVSDECAPPIRAHSLAEGNAMCDLSQADLVCAQRFRINLAMILEDALADGLRSAAYHAQKHEDDPDTWTLGDTVERILVYLWRDYEIALAGRGVTLEHQE